MSSRDAAPERESDAFGYVCGRCNRCCHNKRIQVNPYEIARLARARGQSAAAFRAQSIVDGVYLKQTDTGACVFLGPRGCEVHGDRPLVCRLYPLGRHIRDDASVRFSLLEGHPQTAGRFGGSGTVADYMTAQGAGPFVQAADDYFFWWCRASEALGGAAKSDDPIGADDAAEWLDLDVAVERRCAAAGVAAPEDLEQRRRMHLTILDEFLKPAHAGNRSKDAPARPGS